MKAWLSMMPVEGDNRAAVQDSAGSIASASSRESRARSGTPLAAARPWIASSLPASSSFVATISLPQRAWGRPRSRQYSYSMCLPSTQARAIRLPAG